MLNRAEVIGNLGKDPTVTPLENGNKVATFSVATTEKGYTKQDGTKVEDKTEWHNIVVFGKLVDVVGKYLKKGSKVYVSGKMRTRSYDDKQGVTRYTTEIVVQDMEMLDSKPQSTLPPPPTPSDYQTQTTPTQTVQQQVEQFNNAIQQAPLPQDDGLPF